MNARIHSNAAATIPVKRPLAGNPVDLASRFARYVVCAYFPAEDINFQLAEVIQLGLATELMWMLRPAIPDASMRLYGYIDDDMSQFQAAEQQSQRITDLVIWLRDVDQPGKVFLRLLGMHGTPREIDVFEGIGDRSDDISTLGVQEVQHGQH